MTLGTIAHDRHARCRTARLPASRRRPAGRARRRPARRRAGHRSGADRELPLRLGPRPRRRRAAGGGAAAHRRRGAGRDAVGVARTGSRWCRGVPAAACPAARRRWPAAWWSAWTGCARCTIDPDYRVAVVEPGALNAEVKAAAREHGLWYPPDPSSFEICSIGGNIATNAGGLCCVKYGVTTDYVLGLDVVLADGTAITLGGARLKDVAGLSLLKLFVGSEGTLGVITRAVLRLVPAQQPPSTLVAPVRRRPGRRRGGGADQPEHPAGDAGADGPGVDQRRRGPPVDGAGPDRRGAAGGPVRRRLRRRGRDRRDRRGLRRPAVPSRCSPPPTRPRARPSRWPGGRRSRRSSGAAR